MAIESQHDDHQHLKKNNTFDVRKIRYMKTRKRPLIFTVLTFFSMGGGFLGVLIGILSIIDVELIRVFARIPGYASIFSLTTQSHMLYPYVKVLLYGISFAGALFMFQSKRKGFFMYSGAQLILLIVPYLMWNEIPVVVFFTDLPDMIFTFAFIGAYSLYLSSTLKQDQLADATGTEK